ncbi:MAG TPA: MopE-related protein [Nitrosopumilaceae archaeon]|nr:MopE-related protein [Nitrosopumilaceae archaeon]
MKKGVWAILIILAFFSGTLVSGSFVFANIDQCEKNPPQGQNKGAPFLEIWAAICDLKNQLDEIELTPGPQGPQGEQGEQGPPGTPGDDGQDGLSCWDLNENQSCDFEEDVNAPAGCDALDCQGPPGQGISSQQCQDGYYVAGIDEDGNIICVPLPSSPSPFCGDGTVNGGETCDDGNNANGDGCSSACQVEGSFCSTANCDDGNSCTVDTCDEGSNTCSNTPIAGCVTDFSGTWNITPNVSYTCGLGEIDFNFNTIQVIDNNPNISFITSGNPDTMIGTITGNSFVASKTISGPCTETYTVSGTFTDQNSFSATFSAQYVGQDCTAFGFDPCTNQSWQIAGTLPSCSAEVCNGIDDDCDGTIDNGNPGGGSSCLVAGQFGVCSTGTLSCTNGGLVCNPTTLPGTNPETCNGLDDDCDGQADEANPGGGESCNTGLSGVCSAGTSACTNGALICNPTTQPSPEACNGTDDDCDGTVDEDAVCEPPTAFRLTDLDLRDPHVFLSFLGCRDVTDTQLIGFSVNGELQLTIQTDGDVDGRLDYSPMIIFRPLDQSSSNGNLDFAEGVCTAPMAGTTCDLALAPAPVSTLYTNVNLGTCLDVISGTSTPRIPPYSPAIVTPIAPTQCFVNDRFDVNVPLLGALSLTNVQVAANYNTDPATGLVNGLLRGFLPESVADSTIIPATTPLAGGQPLSLILPGGTNSCPSYDDRDDFDGDGTRDGWWFYFNYQAERVPYVGP